MKALFRKDLYIIRSIGLLFILLDVFFCFIPDLKFFAFAAFYTVMLSTILMQADEQCKWDTLLPMLPVSRRQVVLEAYLLNWGYIASTTAIAVGSQLIWAHFGYMAVGGAYFTVLCFDLFIALAAQAGALPVLFRFGTTKGRIVMIVLICLVTALSLGLLRSGFEGILTLLTKLRSWHLLLLGAALSLASVPLSVDGYARRLKK